MSASPRCQYCGAPVSPVDHHIPAPPTFPLTAEQIVDLAAEMVSLISNALGRPQPRASHLDSPEFRLARATGVVPKAVRDRPAQPVSQGGPP